jgi:hypothetical protein
MSSSILNGNTSFGEQREASGRHHLPPVREFPDRYFLKKGIQMVNIRAALDDEIDFFTRYFHR